MIELKIKPKSLLLGCEGLLEESYHKVTIL
jgi:hypothetical protein